MNTMITKVDATLADRFSEFADDILRPSFVGKILKHVKGEYLVGRDGDVLPIGTKVVAMMPTLVAGWT